MICERDASGMPEPLGGIASSWYTWQRVYLWVRHRRPGDREQAPKKWETEAEVFWGARPPQMVDDRTMSFAHPSGEFFYYLSEESNAYFLDLEERGTRKRYWMFRLLEDAEKYVLCALCDATQAVQRTDTLWQRWGQSGLDPRVQLSYPDIDQFPGRVLLTVDQEPIDRGWMGKEDAIAFSHPILFTVDQLRAVLRAEFPDEAFGTESAQH